MKRWHLILVQNKSKNFLRRFHTVQSGRRVCENVSEISKKYFQILLKCNTKCNLTELKTSLEKRVKLLRHDIVTREVYQEVQSICLNDAMMNIKLSQIVASSSE